MMTSGKAAVPAQDHRAMAPETKAQKDARMEWWKEARFGMFIHFGLYSVPAGEWGGKTGYGEWLREEAHIPVGEYEKLKDQFNPVNFDADAIVRMAKDAGMKYVVITTKHHDGFNLFDSPLTDWNVAHTPYKKDIMAQMAGACKKYGLKMCWYHSIMDWHHPDYLPRRTWEAATRPADGADFRRFVKYLREEVSWILTHYGPIGVMWFDGEWESTWNSKDGDELYALCRRLQPGVIVNNRVTVGRGGIEDATAMQAGDYTTPEQTIPATGLPGVDWETCMTMNDHWGFNSHDTHWKSSREMIRMLVDIASKGGNYLLNIGPRGDGSFPPEAVERLKDIGGWMGRYGESITGTSASVFENLPWGRSTTKRIGDKTRIYLQVFDWPKNGELIVPGIGNKPVASWIPGDRGMGFAERKGSDILVHVRHDAPSEDCSVVVLEVQGAPVVYKAPKILAASGILVSATSAAIEVPSGLAVRYTLDGSDPVTSSDLYSHPVKIDHGSILKAASFAAGHRVSAIVEQRFEKVAPWPSEGMQQGYEGIWCDEYKGDFNSMPDWSKLANPHHQFLATDLSAPATEYLARRYEGYLSAPADEVYSFALTSDDGSKLWIDGKLVVDNDGLHSSTTKSGAAPLAKGMHRITVEWFNKTGGSELDLKWGAVGQPMKALGGSALLSRRRT